MSKRKTTLGLSRRGRSNIFSCNSNSIHWKYENVNYISRVILNGGRHPKIETKTKGSSTLVGVVELTDFQHRKEDFEVLLHAQSFQLKRAGHSMNFTVKALLTT